MTFFSWVPRYVRDLAGIPQPEARVDPAQFLEADYPVYCMRCGYELRGLTELRCPECGEAFERGQLLVEQYVRCRRPRSDRRDRLGRQLGRLGWALLVGGWAVFLSFVVPEKIWPDAVYVLCQSADVLLLTVVAAPIGTQLLACVCWGLATVLIQSRMPPREKRRAARAAWRAELRKTQK